MQTKTMTLLQFMAMDVTTRNELRFMSDVRAITVLPAPQSGYHDSGYGQFFLVYEDMGGRLLKSGPHDSLVFDVPCKWECLPGSMLMSAFMRGDTQLNVAAPLYSTVYVTGREVA